MFVCRITLTVHGPRHEPTGSTTALQPESWSDVASNRTSDLFLFFFLSYAITWPCFGFVAIKKISPSSSLGFVLILLGAIAPSLSALAVTARTDGEAGVLTILRRITKWQVAGRYYVFALTFTVAIKLSAALLIRAATGAWPRFGVEPLILIPFAIAISTPVQAGEEIGWRGYALPRLASRFGLAWASVILGVIWALWHLPQFFIRGGESYGQSFLVFSIGVVAFSVVLAWLYWRTNGSLLLTMLLHAAYNNSKDVVPSTSPGAMNTFSAHASLVAWLSVSLLWVCAAYFLARMAKMRAVVPVLVGSHSQGYPGK